MDGFPCVCVLNRGDNGGDKIVHAQLDADDEDGDQVE